MRGRGSSDNPANRFERLHLEWEPGEAPEPRTEFLIDRTRSVITCNDSPDIGYDYSVNPYRGCEHGCIYCYARPTHEYLGFSSGLDFESRILVKIDAPSLLRRELSAPSWVPKVVALSGVTDPYQPVEQRLRLTRECLAVLAEFGNPVTLVTKNHLVTRDLDLLEELARVDAIQVRLSITTLDGDLHRLMEPRTSTPARRFEAVERLSRQGIPVGVLVAPVIPGLTEHEMPAILRQARERGARAAHFQLVRLPFAVKDLFTTWLQRHYPERAGRVVNRIREVRGGRLNDSRFHHRMKGRGEYARQIAQLFEKTTRKLGFESELPPLSTRSFRSGGQLSLPWK